MEGALVTISKADGSSAPGNVGEPPASGYCDEAADANVASASTPPATISSETEKEKRRWPSPSGPKTPPGTVAIFAPSRSVRAAWRESVPSQDGTFGKR